jgi:hypothetical protein
VPRDNDHRDFALPDDEVLAEIVVEVIRQHPRERAAHLDALNRKLARHGLALVTKSANRRWE